MINRTIKTSILIALSLISRSALSQTINPDQIGPAKDTTERWLLSLDPEALYALPGRFRSKEDCETERASIPHDVVPQCVRLPWLLDVTDENGTYHLHYQTKSKCELDLARALKFDSQAHCYLANSARQKVE